jgi:hypothetical protein
LDSANQKGKHISAGALLAQGPDGPAREAVTCGEGWVDTSKAGPVKPNHTEDSNEKLISNFN